MVGIVLNNFDFESQYCDGDFQLCADIRLMLVERVLKLFKEVRHLLAMKAKASPDRAMLIEERILNILIEDEFR